MQFTDSQFMSAAQKARVLKQWQRFVKGGFKPSGFTKDLYSHLSVHYSFIAHYDRGGFYAARFADAHGRIKTMQDLRDACHTGDYKDITMAMFAAVAPEWADIERIAHKQRINELLMNIDMLQDKLEDERAALSALELQVAS